jgi:hypothetical protein
MASTKKGGDPARRPRPASQSEQSGHDPPDPKSSDKELPDDGGTESDRGTLVRQDRNFDNGPAPTPRK